MPSQEEWCQQQLANLRIADRRLETLAEIRHHLSMQPNSSTNWLSMRDIFNCIEDSNPENILPSNGTTTTLNNNSQQTALACDILAMCMSNLSIDESSANREYLIKCLKHSNIDVRLLGLNEVERLSRADNARTLDANTINAIIECLRHASESVSAPALRLLLRNLPGASIADPGIRSYLAQSLLVSDVVRCRVYDIAVGIAARSTADMESVSFLLAPLLVDLECGDPLLLMNVLEFVATLAQSGHSFVYLQNNGVLSKVGQLTQSMLTNPLASILVPGYLKFFGAVATTQPRLVIVEQPAIITTLFELFNDMTDLRMLPIALDTLGHLCRSTEGAILLHSQHPERLRNALVALRNSINNLPTVIKQRALNSLEEMMLPDTYPINNQMTYVFVTFLTAEHRKLIMSNLLEFSAGPMHNNGTAG